jgi:hypothetical protein
MHLIHKWEIMLNKKPKVKKYDDDYNIKTTWYKCSICNKLKSKDIFIEDVTIHESFTNSRKGINKKEFWSWKSRDYTTDESNKRVKRVMQKALKWINDNNINVINIEEDSYIGGKWLEEKRGSTVTIFYKITNIGKYKK